MPTSRRFQLHKMVVLLHERRTPAITATTVTVAATAQAASAHAASAHAASAHAASAHATAAVAQSAATTAAAAAAAAAAQSAAAPTSVPPKWHALALSAFPASCPAIAPVAPAAVAAAHAAAAAALAAAAHATTAHAASAATTLSAATHAAATVAAAAHEPASQPVLVQGQLEQQRHHGCWLCQPRQRPRRHVLPLQRGSLLHQAKWPTDVPINLLLHAVCVCRLMDPRWYQRRRLFQRHVRHRARTGLHPCRRHTGHRRLCTVYASVATSAGARQAAFVACQPLAATRVSMPVDRAWHSWGRHLRHRLQRAQLPIYESAAWSLAHSCHVVTRMQVGVCNFDNGDCVIAASPPPTPTSSCECPSHWLGDNVCDDPLYNCAEAVCNFDGGECAAPSQNRHSSPVS